MKHLLSALILASIPASLCAYETTSQKDGFEVKLGGSLDTQYGYRKQKGALDKNNYNGDKLEKGAIVNDTKVSFSAENKASNGTKYGGFVEIYADSSPNSTSNPETTPSSPQIGKKMYVYGESEYGRVEAGGGSSVSSTLQVSANSIAKATGGINGKAQKWISSFANIDDPTSTLTFEDRVFFMHFIKWPSLPFDADGKAVASKITYYTPKCNGLQAGISYIPDESMHGTISKTHSVFSRSDLSYKRIMNGGLKYEGKVGDIEIATAFTAEIGKAKKKDPSIARNDLAAWELGSTFKYKGFSIAGSFSDWKKTGTPKIKAPGRKYGGFYWTAGIGYEQDRLGLSVTYFNSKRANMYNGKVVQALARDVGYNKFELISIGAEYQLAEGLMPYAEFNTFKTKQHTASVSNQGNVFIAGTKLKF